MLCESVYQSAVDIGVFGAAVVANVRLFLYAVDIRNGDVASYRRLPRRMVTFQGQEAEGKIRRRQFTVWNYGPMMAGSKDARNCELPAAACGCGIMRAGAVFLPGC